MNIHDLFIIAAELQNAGLDCWRHCGSVQGRCEWCGTEGYCCTTKINWNDTSNGCDGTFGGARKHECTLKPGKSFKIDQVIKYDCNMILNWIYIHM